MVIKRPFLLISLFTTLVLIVTAFTSAAFAHPSLTFTVNSSNDVIDALPGDGVCETVTGNGMCTLRGAIMEANAHIGADTIILPAATYLLTIPGTVEEQSATGDLNITESLTIIGDQSGNTVIDANGLGDRVLQILPAGGPVSISNVFITHGSTTQHGGGIWSMANLELRDVYVIGNHASGYGGGIDSSAPLTITGGNIEQNSADSGGGIYIYASLSLDNILISNNSASRFGGGLYFSSADAQVVNTTFYQNTASTNGAAIYNDRGNLTLRDTYLQNNSCDGRGGGIYTSADGSINLSRVQFLNNHAHQFGGGIQSDGALIKGQDVLFDHNTTDQFGGGGAISNIFGGMYFDRSVFSNNTGDTGAAITNHDEGYIRLIDSTVMSNTASVKGGGIYNYSTMSLQRVTLSGNSAESGGAIYNYGSLSITNSTISGNWASANGGGLENFAAIGISSSTITHNMASSTGTAGHYGGGVYANPGSNLTIQNTILYGNHHRRDLTPYDDDCFGTITTAQYNLIGTLENCSLNDDQDLDIIGADPLLGALADNGGHTLTHALLDSSPAIDTANPAGCIEHEGLNLNTDQRGYSRYWDGDGNGVARCDIGAFEYESRLLFFLPVTLK